MKKTRFFLPIIALFACISFFACENDTTTIGSGIASGEVEINIDTFYFTPSAYAKAMYLENFDSKTGNLLIGNIEVEKYGKLNCSFVTRLMCSPDLEIPDSLLLPERVDSCMIVLGAARESVVGDSLSPQKMSVFLLNKQLPADISNTFNPEGYFDPSTPLGMKSYTVSNVAASDSLLYNAAYVEISVPLDLKFGQEIFEKYRTEPELFQWPQTLAEKFIPGVYMKPTFGRGCVANISQLLVVVFYHSLGKKAVVENGDTTYQEIHVPHTSIPFMTSPEVVSSNNVSYSPSDFIEETNNNDDGICVITTPGGYIAKFEMPVQPIIDRYNEKNTHLSTVNDMYLHLPVESIESTYDISIADNLLLLKASEYPTFFRENKLPDDKTSFTGVYNSSTGNFTFTSLRDYIKELIEKDNITKEDTEFVIVPVEISMETNSNYYGSSSTYVTKCVPLTSKPTMTKINTADAMITFSFSTQLID